VGYWEHRKKIFGKRWLLPLTLSGEGALDTTDLDLLRSGFVVLLHASVADGRYVLYINRCRSPADDAESLESKLRIMFYLMAVAAENDASRNIGFHIVKYLGDDIPEETHYDREATRRTMELLLSKCIPVRVRSLHLLCLTKKKEHHITSSSNILSMMLPLLERWRFISMRTIVHFGSKREEILKSMEGYGFLKDLLPEQVGGTWSYDKDLMPWWTDRTKAECTKFGNLKVASNIPGQTGGKRVARAAFDHIEGMTEEEKLRQKKRAMDAIYARRKRERQRIEMEVLQERCAAIRSKNDELQELNEKLEELIRSAEETVQQHLSYGRSVIPVNEAAVEPIQNTGNTEASGTQRIASEYENAFLAAASILGLCQDQSIPLAALASLQMNQPFLAGGAFAQPNVNTQDAATVNSNTGSVNSSTSPFAISNNPMLGNNSANSNTINEMNNNTINNGNNNNNNAVQNLLLNLLQPQSSSNQATEYLKHNFP
jgi:hypothetical protein